MNKVRLEILRIGSYVNFKNRTDIDYCEVTHLGFPGYVHILRNFKDGENNDDQPENIKDITGIPMSKEWALRFGSHNYLMEVAHIMFFILKVKP